MMAPALAAPGVPGVGTRRRRVASLRSAASSPMRCPRRARPAAGLAAATAGAQAADGQISGQVTDAAGMPLAGITVAAAPVSTPDALTPTTTDAAGNYALAVPPAPTTSPSTRSTRSTTATTR